MLPGLCRKFYALGWMPGTGGALSVRQGDEIYITPSGVQKECVEPDDLFVQSVDGEVLARPPAEKRLKQSTCTPLIKTCYRIQPDCGAVYHLHNQAAVLVSVINQGTEFRITHQKMIQAIKKGNSSKHFDYYDTLVIPIIENKSTEDEIADSMERAMLDYPETSAILIRRHGMYVWGPTWQQTKCMAEAFDYLFDVAVRMKQLGLDPAEIPVAPEGAYT